MMERRDVIQGREGNADKGSGPINSHLHDGGVSIASKIV